MKILAAVGVGKGSEQVAVVLSKRLDADTLYLVCTQESLKNLSYIREMLQHTKQRVIPIVLSQAEDPIVIFNELISKVPVKPDVVDITAGTKSMAAALFLYALVNCIRVSYVTGLKDPIHGKVITGSERINIYETSELCKEIHFKK